ncbi:solute carrier family 2, facilitated glucose transporter member 10-like isoform X7 [Tachypleus tridentatus]|uniref:solute carrier family 2, facilitated glucose transporter member 10-like isoform X7 n=1 Tax=Tachypleus tridentatus TaxID=6853 RepID=UPI003FD56460
MVIKMEEGNSDEDLPATLFSTCHFPKHLSTEDLPNRFVTTSLDVRDKNSGLSKMPRKFLLFAAVTASVGGVMFGYDVGIISGALLQLKLEFQLNCVWQELVVSSLLCGAFLASLVGGIIVDHYGRRMSMVFAGFLFITGSVLLCFSPTIFLVLVGRFVLGFSVSLSVTAECTYISELSTPKHRGMLVSLNEVGITFGFLLAFLVNYIFISVPQGWKYMFGLAAVPAVLQLVGIIFLPRSPHYLLMIGKKEEAAAVLNKVSPGEDTSKQIGSIQRDLSQQKMITYCQLCSSVNNMSVRMVIGMNLVFLQQFTGQTNVLYYAPLIFRQVGYTSNEGATLAALGLGIIKVVAAIVSMLLIDKLGRRVILLTGVLVMTVSIWFLGFVLTFDPSGKVLSVKLMSLAALMLYVFAYGVSFGPVTWLILTEIFPTVVRGRAMSVATSLNWGTNIVMSASFLHFVDSLGIGGTFIFYGGVCIGAIIIIFFMVPETKQKTLEEINLILRSGTYVRQRCSCFQKSAQNTSEYHPLVESLPPRTI